MKYLRNKKTKVIFPYNAEHEKRDYFEVVEFDESGKEISPPPAIAVEPIKLPEVSSKTRRKRRTKADMERDLTDPGE